MLRYFWFSLLVVGSQLLLSQVPKTPEYFYARTDKEFYVAGEDVWYSLFSVNPNELQSRILYVDLVAPDGERLIQQILKMNSQVASGDFALPSNLKTGYYLMRAYTAWNLNFSPQEIYEKEIAVYEANSKAPKTRPNKPLPPSAPETEGNFLTTNKTAFLPGEPIDIAIKGELAGAGGGIVSMSIIDVNYVGEQSRSSLGNRLEEVQQKGRVEFARGQQINEPEKEYTRSFVLKKPGTEEYVSSNFIMGYIKQTQQKLIQSTKEGVVSFTFEDFYGNTVVQIFDTDPFQQTYIPSVSQISSITPSPASSLNQNTPPMTQEVLRYIDGYQKRYQLNKLFGIENNIRAARSAGQESSLTPTNTYKIDDFVQHASMEEFIKNAVPPIKVTKGKKRFVPVDQIKEGQELPRQFQLYVPHKDSRNAQGVVKKPPVLLINDYFSYDSEAVLGMDWDDIFQIDVFNTAQSLPVLFGPVGNFGVIGFKTRDGNTPEKILSSANNLMIQGYYRPRKFQVGSDLIGEDNSSSIPNFQPLTYWNPAISLTAGETVQISVPVSDQPGTYLIRVEGIGKWGNMLVAEKLVEVKL